MTEDEIKGACTLAVSALLMIYVLLYSPPYPPPKPSLIQCSTQFIPKLETHLENIEALLNELIKKKTHIPTPNESNQESVCSNERHTTAKANETKDTAIPGP